MWLPCLSTRQQSVTKYAQVTAALVDSDPLPSGADSGDAGDYEGNDEAEYNPRIPLSHQNELLALKNLNLEIRIQANGRLIEKEAEIFQLGATLSETNEKFIKELTYQREREAYYAKKFMDLEDQHTKRVKQLEDQHTKKFMDLEDQHTKRVKHLEDQHTKRVKHLEDKVAAEKLKNVNNEEGFNKLKLHNAQKQEAITKLKREDARLALQTGNPMNEKMALQPQAQAFRDAMQEPQSQIDSAQQASSSSLTPRLMVYVPIRFQASHLDKENLHLYAPRESRQYDGFAPSRTYAGGTGKVGTDKYGSNDHWDLGLCNVQLYTRRYCRDSRNCEWRHTELTPDERYYIGLLKPNGPKFLVQYDEYLLSKAPAVRRGLDR
ncbi:hypothetical protein GMOD_00006614 [Pyrenophora seminiperda CCB06]|uniref:Uncharacterized protein n=1 Tax=Pyrenophora seminiperda CCB06 TaxID=1302712 RepID=A0A3M7MAW0_9PLEO|nr:hypothetical protein GMOD_00006614 [Pyrenophora seminiperda CCB06]